MPDKIPNSQSYIDYQLLMVPMALYRVTNGELDPILVSDGFCKMMNMDSKQLMHLLKKGTFAKIHPDDAGKLQKAVMDFIHKKGEYDVIYRSELDKSGEYTYVHSFGSWQTLTSGEEVMCVIYLDLSKCVDESEKMTLAYKLALQDIFYTDPLTQLPNINYMNQFLQGRANSIVGAQQTPFLLYADMIGMQSYNDQYGFQAGNNLLCLVALLLREEFPKALVIRAVDDHFVVLDAFESAKLLSSKISKINTQIRQQAEGTTMGLKAGVCIFEDGMDADEALDHAKSAAKWVENDMNRVYCYYTKAQKEKYQKQQYIVENLDQAIKNKWIKVYYQAITRVQTGKVAAFEALARWIDPALGLLPPSDFIPALKKFHLMYKLDMCIAEQACRDLVTWDKEGLPNIPITVNFSAQDFDYIDVVKSLEAMYDKIVGAPIEKQRRLIVEITEQDVAQATDNFHKQIKELKANGFHVWLDDFGTGYSSLSNFGMLDVDLIKFDMDLLRNVNRNKGANRLIMKAMTEIARDIGIHTLSEGMETEDQQAFLKQADCELVQGYLVHKPEPLNVIIDKIKHEKCPRECETDEERKALTAEWLKRKVDMITKKELAT